MTTYQKANSYNIQMFSWCLFTNYLKKLDHDVLLSCGKSLPHFLFMLEIQPLLTVSFFPNQPADNQNFAPRNYTLKHDNTPAVPHDRFRPSSLDL